MKTLRMTPENTEKVRRGEKTATTRMHRLSPGLRELISGSWFKPVRSGVIVEVSETAFLLLNNNGWTLRKAGLGVVVCSVLWTARFKSLMAQYEGYPSWDEFITDLKRLNKKITDDTPLFTFALEVKK